VTGKVQLAPGAESRRGDGGDRAGARGDATAPGPVGVRLGAMRPTPAGRGRQGHFGEAGSF
jgi:hypothetical protein